MAKNLPIKISKNKKGPFCGPFRDLIVAFHHMDELEKRAPAIHLQGTEVYLMS